jgi:hypothetical protein
MSKNSQKPSLSNIEDNTSTGTFNVLTKEQTQQMLKDHLAFTHGLLEEEKPISGVLTVASVEGTEEEESHGKVMLTCSNHQYYSLLLSAVETTLTAMDSENRLDQFGIDKVALASEVVQFLAFRIESSLGLDVHSEPENTDDLDDLLQEHPELVDFLDTHMSSMVYIEGESL